MSARDAVSDWRGREHAAIAALGGYAMHQDACMALVESRGWKEDVRPQLVRWFVGRDDAYIDTVLRFVGARLIFHAGRRRIVPCSHGFAVVLLDVLWRVRSRDRLRVWPAEDAAKVARLRKADYIELRRAGELHLLRAIYAGLGRYLVAYGAREREIGGETYNGLHATRIRAIDDGRTFDRSGDRDAADQEADRHAALGRAA